MSSASATKPAPVGAGRESIPGFIEEPADTEKAAPRDELFPMTEEKFAELTKGQKVTADARNNQVCRELEEDVNQVVVACKSDKPLRSFGGEMACTVASKYAKVALGVKKAAFDTHRPIFKSVETGHWLAVYKVLG